MADQILVTAFQKWSEPRETRYVELFVVTDSTEVLGVGCRRDGQGGGVQGCWAGRDPRLPLRVCRPPVPAVWEQRGRASAGAGGGQPRGQGGRYFRPGGFQQGPLGPLGSSRPA